MMRKMFADAIEVFRLITYNPVLKSLRPRVPKKEALYLNLEETRRLLMYVQGRPFEIAIWLQLFLGLRVGELQALTWSDIDLEEGFIRIRKTYVRKEKVIRDYPKGKKHHSQRIPFEVLHPLRKIRGNAEAFVVTSPEGGMLSYEWYSRTLRKYCRELGIPKIGTHGLRHSTSCLYLSYGASRDDIRQLFVHSSSQITERYIHYRGTNLDKVAQVIRLFPESSQNLPRFLDRELEESKGGVLSS